MRDLVLAVSVLGLCGALGCSKERAEADGATATADAGHDAGSLVADAGAARTIRLGHYNIKELSTNKLLDNNDGQANAAAEILARFDADILEINEIQYDIAGVPNRGLPGAAGSPAPGDFADDAQNGQRLADRIHAADNSVTYTDTLMLLGNSGFYFEGDDMDVWSYTLRGWGEWEGRFATAVLSKYPILRDQVRVIADFEWENLPDNKIAQMHEENGMTLPPHFPLFEKSLNIVPIDVDGVTLYLVLLHPTASPASFDPINPYRNFDELRALDLFLRGELPGVEPLPEGALFVVSGDLNADPNDGDGIEGAVDAVVNNPSLIKSYPRGAGSRGYYAQFNTFLGGCGNDDGETVSDPTTRFQMQLDYQLPSVTLGAPLRHEMFFPDYQTEREDFDLACYGSDHRFLWMDVAPG